MQNTHKTNSQLFPKIGWFFSSPSMSTYCYCYIDIMRVIMFWIVIIIYIFRNFTIILMTYYIRSSWISAKFHLACMHLFIHICLILLGIYLIKLNLFCNKIDHVVCLNSSQHRTQKVCTMHKAVVCNSAVNAKVKIRRIIIIIMIRVQVTICI